MTSVGGSTRKAVGVQSVEYQSVQALDAEALAQTIASLPNDYNFNNSLINAAPIHAAGNTGQGIIVGLIDTGTTNSVVVPSLAGTVIGGENFLPADPVTSATSRRNDPHGTWTGGVIASHAVFGFANTSSLIRSMKLHAPSSIQGACPAAPAPWSAQCR